MEQYWIPIVAAIAGFFLKEFVAGFKEKDSTLTLATQQNTVAIQSLNIAITELRGSINVLLEQLKPVPKLEKDVNNLYRDMREVKVKLKLQGALPEDH